jgi:regulator of sirC expression with transglutaminase-like and TPR domain
VVLLELGGRVGVPLLGVGFPGHFLVRHACHPRLLLDPFDRGNVLTHEDCAGILDHLTRGRIPFTPRLLQPVGPRDILQRILNNLCGVYLSAGDVDRALTTLDRVLLLCPGEPRVLRGRGILRLKAGDCRGAVADLEAYLEAEPGAADWEDIAAAVDDARGETQKVH